MDFDLIVIGGGMAGIGAAKAAADLGARTALAEHEKLGARDSIAGASRRRPWSGPHSCSA